MINKDKLLLYKLCKSILEWYPISNEIGEPKFVTIAREHMCSIERIPSDD